MFNLNKEVQRLQQLEHAKIHGLPYKPKPKRKKIIPADDTVYNKQAQQEGKAISKRYKSHTMDFGRRLIKRKGQKHHPGGGLAIHTEKKRQNMDLGK